MYLSQENIEQIGNSILRDYEKRYPTNPHIPVDIEKFAQNYLGLQIEYQKLSETESILGLTSYKGIILELAFSDGSVHLSVPEDTILLDEHLERAINLRRRRFTIAHECAHQIIARIEESKTGCSFRRALITGQTYSCRDLHTKEDWSEWQANALGAVLLIPKMELIEELEKGFTPFVPTLYGNRLNAPDYKRVKELSDIFCVSMAAMKIRLKELKRLITKPASEYADPRDVIYDYGGK